MTEYTPVTTTTATKVPTLPDAQTVLDVKHWTDRLFSFRVSRPQSLRFRSGEFVMIGLLKDDGKPLLRAYGHVISDQYAMARRSGFDDIEVSKALATRQPEAEWLFRSNWSAHDYQTRLRKSA